jgi:2-polyprenyl-3-methyl-5-hydroxy-6-metoxy-1,4-benzoquinol methylase
MTSIPNITSDYQTDKRMALKRRAIPLPDVQGKRCLDIGCDFGSWSWLLADSGASYVLGLDRNRVVKGAGHVDLVDYCRKYAFSTGYDVCDFEQFNLGRQWHSWGEFDLVLMFSLYHHVFENVEDHRPIWYWLGQHVSEGGGLLWENPTSVSDPVVRANVSASNQANYTLDKILAAAQLYFTAEYIGPAMHESTREVWRFRPLPLTQHVYEGAIGSGTGGATKAFLFDQGRRIHEIERALGFRAFPGSLNVYLDEAFRWDDGYLRAQVLDPVCRDRGLDVEWAPRWARFYPLLVDGVSAYAFRFEGEKYKSNFVELIAPEKLRPLVGQRVTICHPY